ncbi:hydroxymethylpyrimidine/phosphomethylpyrimidine kinase [Bartonella henselae]|nr:hydroxymethylpyrimidine/phosphomethylpyrimidine kinase [Bartonella henselae]MDM9996380.1 hydroxymethylpyrimidine/phosphomethylpyrimidine kinase [Bartonella henselae]OLL48459.1 hydroxymethylpyrimidine/phosphomethylpyrimidine kinase [Bartonella henselae]OLL48787.1 hydroxymethylpyrimidine/phosphomethylpyrimidine kinase [Bartonella henselae]OLL49880.1 hydroxymethylpyrimidine/phosphomethylpyrimidine kinase [Bartonella henselae]OLL57434.1 hydroxymethylpyrimidine/phosphomethylpyrimidine kinase [Ba
MALMPSILIVAGTDPTGGAGIVRDIETAAHFQIKANLAITCINVQNDNHVAEIVPMCEKLIAAQMRAALEVNPISAIKIGMTGNQAIIAAICNVIEDYPHIPVILDPVLFASSGGKLITEPIIEIMINKLLPYVDLLTPNREELALLSQTPLASCHKQAIQQAKKLLSFGPRSILIKGGHADGPLATDSFIDKTEIIDISTVRLTRTIRGTGCILSSAIAAHLALNESMIQAIKNAKEYIYKLLLNHNQKGD